MPGPEGAPVCEPCGQWPFVPPQGGLLTAAVGSRCVQATGSRSFQSVSPSSWSVRRKQDPVEGSQGLLFTSCSRSRGVAALGSPALVLVTAAHTWPATQRERKHPISHFLLTRRGQKDLSSNPPSPTPWQWSLGWPLRRANPQCVLSMTREGTHTAQACCRDSAVPEAPAGRRPEITSIRVCSGHGVQAPSQEPDFLGSNPAPTLTSCRSCLSLFPGV